MLDRLLEVPGIDSDDLVNFIRSLRPYVLYRMRQTAGTTEPNEAAGPNALGSALDMTLTSVTLGQTGKLGANEAYQMDGANSLMRSTGVAALAGIASWEYVWLFNIASAGEGSQGAFAYGENGLELYMRFNSSLNSLAFKVTNTGGTAFTTLTNTGFSTSTWSLLFARYDDAGDRLLRAYKGVAGNVSELGYSAQPALTGTFRPPTGSLCIGNRVAQDNTLNGLIDLMFIAPPLSAATRLKLTQMVGV